MTDLDLILDETITAKSGEMVLIPAGEFEMLIVPGPATNVPLNRPCTCAGVKDVLKTAASARAPYMSRLAEPVP